MAEQRVSNTDEFDWQYWSDGRWIMASCYQDGEVDFEWVIEVREDGIFYVDESDQELTTDKSGRATFAAAKAYCEASERVYREEAEGAR